MSTRITTLNAKIAARQYADAVYQPMVEECGNNITAIVKELYVKYIPHDLRDIAEWYSHYYNECQHVHFKFEQRIITVYFKNLFVIPDLVPIEVNSKEFNRVIEADRKLHEVTAKKMLFLAKTANAIYKLRTLDKVKKLFPEVVPYYPVDNEVEEKDNESLDNLREMVKEAKKGGKK